MAGQRSFSADVDAWVRSTDSRLRAVFHEATQEVVSEMQKTVEEGGNMPVDLGYLRASLAAGINAPANTASRPRPADAQPVAYSPEPINLVIAGAKIGDEVYATYGMNYAAHQEYGTSKMAGRGFVRLAALQWQAIVNRVTERVKARISSRSA